MIQKNWKPILSIILSKKNVIKQKYYKKRTVHNLILEKSTKNQSKGLPGSYGDIIPIKSRVQLGTIAQERVFQKKV